MSSSLEGKLTDLDCPLQRILKDNITLSEDKCKMYNKNLQYVLQKKLLPQMKDDPVFKKLFKEFHYGGSYYENLKITNPNEFDIHVELCLPFHRDSLKVIPSGDRRFAGFARMNTQLLNDKLPFSPNTDENVIRCVDEWFDNYGNLLRTKVVSWMQGIVDCALEDSNIPYPVVRSVHGPAITLKISAHDLEFSVDLVPVFGFDVGEWPDYPIRQPHEIPRGGYFLNDGGNVTRPQNFQQPETGNGSGRRRRRRRRRRKRYFATDNSQRTYLRDVNEWKGLSSYYLKTIFMWEQTKWGKKFWRRSLGELYMHMLSQLEKYLCEEEIRFFWDQRCNLIRKLPQEFIENTRNCVVRIIHKITSHLRDGDPEYIFEVYRKVEGFQDQETREDSGLLVKKRTAINHKRIFIFFIEGVKGTKVNGVSKDDDVIQL